MRSSNLFTSPEEGSFEVLKSDYPLGRRLGYVFNLASLMVPSRLTTIIATTIGIDIVVDTTTVTATATVIASDIATATATTTTTMAIAIDMDNTNTITNTTTTTSLPFERPVHLGSSKLLTS